MSYVDFEKYTNIDTNNPSYGFSINPEPAIFFEPAFTGRVFFGKSPIYSQFQTGFSFTTQGQTQFEYEPFHFSFGFGFRLGGQPKKSSEQ
jgi:hypothetical protein